MGQVSYETIAALAWRAITEGGEQKTLGVFVWDVAGNCEHPIIRELWARPHPWHLPIIPGVKDPAWAEAFVKAGWMGKVKDKYYSYDPGKNPRINVDMTVRCRVCERCRRKRAGEWIARAMSEIQQAGRTWLLTLTLSPGSHWRLTAEARLAAAQRQVRFEELDEVDQYRQRVDAIGPDITRYIKRVRKESGVPIRYLFIAERHKSGLPHFHALVHEVDGMQPLRKRVLKGQWHLGYSDVKLITDGRSAAYICKYLTKDAATRVRSSLHYGRTRPQRLTRHSET